MMRSRQPRFRQTRQKLLEAARLLMQSRGYANVSMEEIARQAGMAKGTVFAHFGDKYGLISTLLVEELAAIEDLADGENSTAPASTRLVQIVSPFVALLSRERIVLDIYLKQVGVTNDICSPEFMVELQRLQHGLIQTLESWQHAERIRTDVTAAFLADGVIAFVTQAVSRRLCGEIPSAFDQHALLEAQFAAWFR